MEVEFPRLIANSNDFPEAIIKANPTFSVFDIFNHGHKNKLNFATLTKNGRGAIGIAAKQLLHSVKPNIVLIPAYHCPALVEPFIWLGYEIRFYPVKDDLTVDPVLLQQLLTEDVTHCVVVRFFGFNQNVDQIINLVNQSGKYIIEDCAHSLVDFLDRFALPTSKVDARVSSINKLLPTIDGGLLYLKDHKQINIKYCNWLDEFKGLAYLLNITKMLNFVRSKKPEVATTPVIIKQSTNDSALRYFSPKDLKSASFRHTKFILQYCDMNKVQKARKKNFDYLAAGLADSKAGKALYTSANDAIPYVFPYLLNDAEGFSRLRRKKIQALRWEEVAHSDCEISHIYRTNLIQLPCHHKLTRSQLDHIIDAVNSLDKN